MSDTNRVQLGIIEETTFNTTPGSPTIYALRITEAPDLSLGPVTVTSNELRSDRQTTDLTLVNKEPGGSIGHELSYEALDLLFEGALFGDWELTPELDNAATTGLVAGATSTSNAFSILSGGTSCGRLGTGFLTNCLIQTSNFSNVTNNGIFVVISQTAQKIYVSAGVTTEDTSTGTTEKIKMVGLQGGTGDITATGTAGSSPTLTTTTIDWTAQDVEPGDWIRIGGGTGYKFTSATQNNDWVRVDIDGTISSTVLPLDIVPATWAADSAATETIRVFLGDRLVNYTTEKSYSLEEQFADHDPVRYVYYTGQEIDRLTLNFEAATIVTASVAFVGAGGSTTTSRVDSPTDVAAPTESVMNTSSHVGFIGEGGSAITSNYVMSGTIEINNNLRRQNAVGTLGAIGIGAGECTITGRLNTYFEDGTLFNKIMNNTETSFAIVFDDQSDNSLVIDLPRTKYTEGAPAVPGKNQDVMVDLGYQALRQADVDYQIKVQRFDYVINSNS